MSRIIPVTNTIHIPSNKTEKKMQSLVVPSDSAYCPAITSFHSFEAPVEKKINISTSCPICGVY